MILSCLAAASALMAAAYALDLLGIAMHPAVLAVAAIAGGAAAARALLAVPPSIVVRGWAPGPIAASAAVFVAATGYALWLASPSFLPATIGPDVVHHLQLIHYLERAHRLPPHDPALAAYLAEMIGYTPGSHVLAVALAAWFRTDPINVLHPLVAVFVGMKAAMLYRIARRILMAERTGGIEALSAPIFAAVPAVYFFGSFLHFFYLSQVLSETFAVAMLLCAVAWTDSGERHWLWICAACGVGVFLSWPPWIAPGLVAVATAVLSRDASWRDRLIAVSIGAGPVSALAVVHQLLHPSAASIVTSAGVVTEPSVAAFGVAFLVLAGVGLVAGLAVARARPVALFLLATLAQAALLAYVIRQRGSTSLYMPFKMMYLAILPAGVLAAMALSWLCGLLRQWVPRGRAALSLVPLAVAIALAWPRVPHARVRGSITRDAYAAGLWARGNVPPQCVDYFSKYWLAGYWLHLDVLGNPRASDRMRNETFEFPDVLLRWFDGRGLPFAFVEDMAAIPREVRADMIELRRFGSAAIVRNRRPASCSDTSPSLWTLVGNHRR